MEAYAQPSEVLALAAELRAEARAHGIDLSLDDALVIAQIRLPVLEMFASAYDAWAAAEEARVVGASDAQHLAYDAEVFRLVSAA